MKLKLKPKLNMKLKLKPKLNMKLKPKLALKFDVINSLGNQLTIRSGLPEVKVLEK